MTDERRNLDVITIGRAGVDLYGQQVGGKLEDVQTFAKYLGGCPANIAVGAARLGLRSAIITRVGDDHMGRFLLNEFVREGVCIDGIGVDPDRLTALVVLGIRDRETFPLIFYRENCADMALGESDIDEALIADARSILLTGTHLSTAQTRAACLKAATLAKGAGKKVILDVDYRPVLWGLTAPSLGEQRFVSSEAVTALLQELVPMCDLIVGTEEELHILGGETDTIAAMHAIRALTGATIVCKRGPRGSSVFPGEIPGDLDKGLSGESFQVEVYNVLGAGDAFMSGFLSGWLRDKPLEECCRLGNACGAIVVSRHGCAPAIPTREELDWFLEHGSEFQALRKDEKLEWLHWSTTRGPQRSDLAVLAIDHRSQFEELAETCGAPRSRIAEFKALALRALTSVAPSDISLGVLLDSRHGADALYRAADLDCWVGRAIELPGSRPLAFDTDLTVSGELREWPAAHVVKCLSFYHPEDPINLRCQQQAQIREAYRACRELGREFLLEIICSKDGEVGHTTASDAMQQLYEAGIYPDWWKLEPSADPKAWVNLTRTIEQNDPHCRGILLLGLAADAAAVLECFKVAAAFPLVRGFAVGRTIFFEPARQWLSGEVSDEEAVGMLTRNFTRLIDGWRLARRNG